MDNAPGTDSRTSTTTPGQWGLQKLVVVVILWAIAVYYALALPLFTMIFSLIPLGLVVGVLAIAATRFWPGSSPRDTSAQ